MENKDSTSTINIDVDVEWVRELENKAIYETQRQVGYQNTSIFKVPGILRRVQPEAYEPVIVSLGPYHYHKPRFQVTNQLKWLLLDKLLEKGHEKSLGKYLILIKEEATKARNTYSKPPTDMCEKKFIEMMLLDCVFVIMILWFWKNEGLEAIEDPIFMSGQRSWTVVARDMLLLENQLPFFLLEALFDSAFPNSHGRLKKWVVQFFSGFVNDKMPEVPEDAKTIHHILHLFYLCIIVPLNRSSNNVFARRPVNVLEEYPRMGRVHTATQLEATGLIKLKRKQKAMSFLDITLEKGVLEIPQIEIDDDTDILFRNLIAFEQCQKSAICYDISTYAWFLSCITDTVNDVELLQKRGIIINRLGNEKKVANLLAKLCEEVVVDHKNCYISRVFEELAKYPQMKYVRERLLEVLMRLSKRRAKPTPNPTYNFIE